MLLFSCSFNLACGQDGPRFYHVENCPVWTTEMIFKAEDKIEAALGKNILIFTKDTGFPIICRELPDFNLHRFCGELNQDIIACAAAYRFIEINIDVFKHHNAQISILMHEMGHLLGAMEHSENKEDVMYKEYHRNAAEKELTEHDIEQFKKALNKR